MPLKCIIAHYVYGKIDQKTYRIILTLKGHIILGIIYYFVMFQITIYVPYISLRRQMRVPPSMLIGNLKKYIPNYQNIILEPNSNLLNLTKTMVFGGIELHDDDTVQKLGITDGDFIIGFQSKPNQLFNIYPNNINYTNYYNVDNSIIDATKCKNYFDNKNGYKKSFKTCNGICKKISNRDKDGDIAFWINLTNDREDFKERMSLLSKKELSETMARIRDLRMAKCFERPMQYAKVFGKMKAFYEDEPDVFKRNQIKLELVEKPEEPSAEPLPVLWI